MREDFAEIDGSRKQRKVARREALLPRVHFLRHWYGYSDPAMEDALHDIPALRRFAGLDAGQRRMPDETTILNFRHLLEAHRLAGTLFQEVVALLTELGLVLREGTIPRVKPEGGLWTRR